MVSDSREGLNKNLAIVKEYCDRVGLKLNVKKSFVFHIDSDGKTYTVNDVPHYMVDDQEIPWVSPESSTRYLGKMIGPWGGMTVSRLSTQIDEWAQKVRKAPIRPFQGLEIWRETIIPRVRARLLHCTSSQNMLKGFDNQIKGHVKSLLHLPIQVSDALIHAKTKYGGLGIPRLADAIPEQNIKGLHKLCWKAPDHAIRVMARELGVRNTLEKMVQQYPQYKPSTPRGRKSGENQEPAAEESPCLEGIPKDKWCTYWAGQKTQGIGADTWLGQKESNAWIRSGALTDGEAISALLLRCNCIPTRECVHRYTRYGDVKCRRCQNSVETVGHISGWCPAVKDSRILRHNSICKILANKATKAGWEVHWEPVYTGPQGNLKPDICKKGDRAIVVDPTIVWENSVKSLHDAADNKEHKYEVLRTQIEQKLEVHHVKIYGLPIGARGGWISRNDQVLKDLGLEISKTKRALTLRALGATITLVSLFMDL